MRDVLFKLLSRKVCLRKLEPPLLLAWLPSAIMYSIPCASWDRATLAATSVATAAVAAALVAVHAAAAHAAATLATATLATATLTVAHAAAARRAANYDPMHRRRRLAHRPCRRSRRHLSRSRRPHSRHTRSHHSRAAALTLEPQRPPCCPRSDARTAALSIAATGNRRCSCSSRRHSPDAAAASHHRLHPPASSALAHYLPRQCLTSEFDPTGTAEKVRLRVFEILYGVPVSSVGMWRCAMCIPHL
jgi:hypothetical protein